MSGSSQPSVVDPFDDFDDEDDYEPRRDGDDHDDITRDRCVLGDRCLVADPYHSSDECFDEEMAKHFMGEESDRD